MTARSAAAVVRNPILSLPGVADLQALPGPAQAALKTVLRSISADARVRAEKCWRTHKAPMAAYWKAVAVYANHTQRVLAGRAAAGSIGPDELASIGERITMAQIDDLLALFP